MTTTNDPLAMDSDSHELVPDLLDAVEQQLQAKQTAYVGKTLQRLIKLGLDEDEARHQIAWCLGKTLDRMMRSQRGFDETHYQERLAGLPLEED